MWNPDRGVPGGSEKKLAVAVGRPAISSGEMHVPGRQALARCFVDRQIWRIYCELWLANGLKAAKSLLVCLPRSALVGVGIPT